MQRVGIFIMFFAATNIVLFSSRRANSVRVVDYADGLINRLDTYRDRVAGQLDGSQGGVSNASVPVVPMVLWAPEVPGVQSISGATSSASLPPAPPNQSPAIPLIPSQPPALPNPPPESIPAVAVANGEPSHTRFAGVLQEQAQQMAKLSEVLLSPPPNPPVSRL